MTRTPKKNGDEAVPAQDQLAAALEITNPHKVSDQLHLDGFELKPQPQGDAEWFVIAGRAIAAMAATGHPFTAHDLVTQLGCPEPENHHRWGPLMAAARANGTIVPVAAVQSTRPRTAKSLTHLWIGAKFAPKPADNHIPSPRPAGDDEVEK